MAGCTRHPPDVTAGARPRRAPAEPQLDSPVPRPAARMPGPTAPAECQRGPPGPGSLLAGGASLWSSQGREDRQVPPTTCVLPEMLRL